MKKHILMVLTFFPSGIIKKAESEAETLEWLKRNQLEVAPYWCYSNTIGCEQAANELKICNEYIELTQKNNYTRIPWNKIKKIEDTGYGSIQIISQEEYDDNNVFIILKFKNREKIAKYTKVLNHMATFKKEISVNDVVSKSLQVQDAY